MYVDWQTIITFSAVLTAIITIFKYFTKVHAWYLKQEKQDTIIDTIKIEQQLLTSGILICLKGLRNIGYSENGVQEYIEKIEDRLNSEAHK